MKLFSRNLKALRKEKGITQGDLGKAIGVGTTTVSNYEKKVSEPDMDTLIAISKYFGITIDNLLLNEPIVANTTSEDLISYKEKGRKNDNPNDNLNDNLSKIEVVTVSTEGTPVIPMLDAKAAAGYPAHIGNTTYLQDMPAVQLPHFRFRTGNFIGLQISGDSMEDTILDGDYVFARQLNSIEDIRDGYVHLLVTGNEVVCKRLYNRVEERGAIKVVSDNSIYGSYDVQVRDVLQLWRVECKLSFNLSSRLDDWRRQIEQRISILEGEKS